jgi:hypothetical protein
MTRVTLSGMPNLGRGYLGALASFARTPPTDLTKLPSTELVAAPVRIDADRAARYNQLCGFDRDAISITYPFVFTFPLQLALMTQSDSPLRLPGLVHLGIDLTAHRALAAGVPLHASCGVVRQVFTERGLEFALAISLIDDGEVAWRAESRILARHSRPPSRSRGTRPRAPTIADTRLGEIAAPGNIGRRYAQVSGDWNPIHLGRLGARTLGFDRPIAHGMWTLASMVAAAQADGVRSASLSAEFVAPLRLPGRLQVRGDAARIGGFDAGSGRLVAMAELKEIP